MPASAVVSTYRRTLVSLVDHSAWLGPTCSRITTWRAVPSGRPRHSHTTDEPPSGAGVAQASWMPSRRDGSVVGGAVVGGSVVGGSVRGGSVVGGSVRGSDRGGSVVGGAVLVV